MNNYSIVKQNLAAKARQNRLDAAARTREVCEKIPELASIQTVLESTSQRIFAEIAKGGDDITARIGEIEQENNTLLAAREEILAASGYAADYCDIRHDCAICEDSGFVETHLGERISMVACTCMRRALAIAGLASSGLGKLVESQSFSSFKLTYYTDRDSAKMAFDECKKYAKNFAKSRGQNLLLIGATGLGKTHLSTSVAAEVIQLGFSVVYETAQSLMKHFERERFGRAGDDFDSGDSTSKFARCDLLIIDDLGTEMTNTFTLSCLYDTINSRLNAGRGMIINTNLDSTELRERYDSRIASRLLGEFRPLLLTGVDVRMQKVKR